MREARPHERARRRAQPPRARGTARSARTNDLAAICSAAPLGDPPPIVPIGRVAQLSAVLAVAVAVVVVVVVVVVIVVVVVAFPLALVLVVATVLRARSAGVARTRRAAARALCGGLVPRGVIALLLAEPGVQRLVAVRQGRLDVRRALVRAVNDGCRVEGVKVLLARLQPRALLRIARARRRLGALAACRLDALEEARELELGQRERLGLAHVHRVALLLDRLLHGERAQRRAAHDGAQHPLLRREGPAVRRRERRLRARFDALREHGEARDVKGAHRPLGVAGEAHAPHAELAREAGRAAQRHAYRRARRGAHDADLHEAHVCGERDAALALRAMFRLASRAARRVGRAARARALAARACRLLVRRLVRRVHLLVARVVRRVDGAQRDERRRARRVDARRPQPVSYTHLTLPTKRIV